MNQTIDYAKINQLNLVSISQFWIMFAIYYPILFAQALRSSGLILVPTPKYSKKKIFNIWKK